MKHIIAIVGVALLFFAEPSAAQIDLKGIIRGKINQAVEETVGEGVDKTVEKTKEGIKKRLKKENGPSDKAKTDVEDERTDEDGRQEKPQGGALKSYSKYDFVPGDQILFYEDFSQDAVGDFPALWTTD